MIINNSNINSINDWADFWYYQIGVNVISADIQNKQINENWSQYQDKSISDELHEQRKRNKYYNKGIVIFPGKIWSSLHEEKYFIGIDIDKEQEIKEFCTRDGKNFTLYEFCNKTIVKQQHKDEFDTDITYPKLLKFLYKSKLQGYELFNVVTDDDDSIFSPAVEELATCEGQVFISEDKIEEIINRIIDHGLGLSLNNKK